MSKNHFPPFDPDAASPEETAEMLRVMLEEIGLTLCTLIAEADNIGVEGLKSQLADLAKRLRENIPPRT